MHNNNILLVGLAGMGKTACVEAHYGAGMVKMLVSSMVEEDIAGLPYLKDGIEYRTIPKHLLDLQQLTKQGLKTCLFLDELDKARQEVADTLLTLIQSRRIGSYELPIDCDIIAACNPPESGGGDGISVPMLSRFTVIEFEPKIAQWCAWAYEHYPHHKNIIDLVSEGIIPLYDTVGDGLQSRTTCPRTLEMAFKIKESPFATIEQQLYGLLTPQAAAQFLENSNTQQCNTVLRKASKATKGIVKPLRI